MTRRQYATIIAMLTVIGLIAILAIANGVYANWASCTRGNTQRKADRIEARAMRASAAALRRRAKLQTGRLSQLDVARAQEIAAVARTLDVPPLSCSVPAPEVR